MAVGTRVRVNPTFNKTYIKREEACADDSAYEVPEAQQEEGEIDEDDDIM